MEIEKNDVDISKLFVWGRVFEVVGEDGKPEALVYMRLLGDADANRARVFAVRQSAELRRKLLDLNSDERIVFVKSIEEVSEEDLRNLIIAYSMREITNNAYKSIKVKKPTPPKSNASLSKMEKYQKEVDDFPTQFKDAVEKHMRKEVDKALKLLEYEDKESLYKRYTNALIDELCEQRAMESYRNMELYLGCYKDDTYALDKRFFSSYDEFDNMSLEVKSEFRAAYDKLDIKPDELKKLREATL